MLVTITCNEGYLIYYYARFTTTFKMAPLLCFDCICMMLPGLLSSKGGPSILNQWTSSPTSTHILCYYMYQQLNYTGNNQLNWFWVFSVALNLKILMRFWQNWNDHRSRATQCNSTYASSVSLEVFSQYSFKPIELNDSTMVLILQASGHPVPVCPLAISIYYGICLMRSALC